MEAVSFTRIRHTFDDFLGEDIDFIVRDCPNREQERPAEICGNSSMSCGRPSRTRVRNTLGSTRRARMPQASVYSDRPRIRQGRGNPGKSVPYLIGAHSLEALRRSYRAK